MAWTLTDDDGYSAFVRDGKTIVCSVRTHTDEEKANARKLIVALEALNLLERIVEEVPAMIRREWLNEARAIVAKVKESKQ